MIFRKKILLNLIMFYLIVMSLLNAFIFYLQAITIFKPHNLFLNSNFVENSTKSEAMLLLKAIKFPSVLGPKHYILNLNMHARMYTRIHSYFYFIHTHRIEIFMKDSTSQNQLDLSWALRYCHIAPIIISLSKEY